MLAGKSPAGRFVPARTFAEVKDVPDWNDFAPRMGLVYDLFGNGKTAVKYSLNRYNLSRTTGIAANYNPLLSQTATLPWRDKNRNDVAEGSLRCDGSPSADCEINFASLLGQLRHRRAERVRRSTRAPGTSSRASRSRTSCSTACRSAASWWHGDFHNLTNTVNQSWSTADYSPYTWYNPTTGAAVHGLRAHARPRPRARPATSTPSTRSARTSTSRTASTPSGAFRAAARSTAASPSSANA